MVHTISEISIHTLKNVWVQNKLCAVYFYRCNATKSCRECDYKSTTTFTLVWMKNFRFSFMRWEKGFNHIKISLFVIQQ